MTEIVFEALPARNGDCLFIELISDSKTRRILVDGGPNTVYDNVLRDRLDRLQTPDAGGRQQSGVIDLLMISHVDDDHINGVIDLLKELDGARAARQRRFVKIRRLWHNSFQALLGVSNDDVESSIRAGFGTATLSGASIPSLPTLDRDDAKVLASVGQGIEVENLANRLNIDRNPGAPGGVLESIKGRVYSPKFSGFSMDLIGPLESDVARLRNKFKAHLKAKGLLPNDPQAALAATTLGRDTSVANLSSIVVHIVSGSRSILLTGDARWDKIIAGLKQHELIDEETALFVDVFKLPHHGSDRNARQTLFEAVVADHYVASGDGLHGNPERNTFEMLFEAQPAHAFTIHLTYSVAHIDAERKKDAEKHGHRWRPAEHSLEALFEEKRNDGHPFALNEGDGQSIIRIVLS